MLSRTNIHDKILCECLCRQKRRFMNRCNIFNSNNMLHTNLESIFCNLHKTNEFLKLYHRIQSWNKKQVDFQTFKQWSYICGIHSVHNIHSEHHWYEYNLDSDIKFNIITYLVQLLLRCLRYKSTVVLRYSVWF